MGEGEVPLPVCVGAGGADDDNGLVVLVVIVVVGAVLVSIVASRVNRSEILFN